LNIPLAEPAGHFWKQKQFYVGRKYEAWHPELPPRGERWATNTKIPKDGFTRMETGWNACYARAGVDAVDGGKQVFSTVHVPARRAEGGRGELETPWRVLPCAELSNVYADENRDVAACVIHAGFASGMFKVQQGSFNVQVSFVFHFILSHSLKR